MKTKPKRIRALRANITRYDTVLANVYNDTEPCYILRQSDIRALAEQMANSIVRRGVKRREAEGEVIGMPEILSAISKNTECILCALRRAGMTPGKERAK